jgi:hypothetical protein
MIKYRNEIINTNNIIFIKDYPNALSIHFIGGTNHWLLFDNEESKNAILTSIKLQMK